MTVDRTLNDERDRYERRKPHLHGWDDEKVYYWTNEREICVSDIPELMAQLEEVCRKYLRRVKAAPGVE
jgi:hypothetical protein